MKTADLDARATTVPPHEAARRIGWAPRTLANRRWDGSGPPYLKIGGRVRYRLADLADWLDQQVRSSTSEPGSGGGKPGPLSLEHLEGEHGKLPETVE